jgi:hypothetical protein
MSPVATEAGDGPGTSDSLVHQRAGSTEPEPAGTPLSDSGDARITDRTDGASKRRFRNAVLIGIVVTAIPYLWVLCDLWTGSPSLFRTAWRSGYASNFYDLQARAMFHGHLYVANGALGGEAFVHGGHQFTYFGLFPSLLRMPILLLTSSLDGKLSAPSILVAWLVTALFVSLLLWRLRIVVRGSVVLGRAEAASYGVLVATIMGGSVLMSLATSPWVFSEDVAWSVALTMGSLFALLGVLERPSWGRVVTAGCLILAANLTRGSTGYACVLGAIFVALWFGLDRRVVANRRWALPMLVAGLVPLAASSAEDYAKFGILFGLAASDQIVYQTLIHKGSYFGLRYFPSDLRAYFGPTGLRLRTVFPFITLPSLPAQPVGNVTLYGNDWVASVPTAMPLLFLLSLWGTVTAIRPGGGTSSWRIRILLATAAVAGGTVMIYGWITNRFVGDLIPVLVVGAAIGMVDLWRRLPAARHRRGRRWALVLVSVLGVFGVAANIGIAVTFQGNWSNQQLRNSIAFENDVSNITGHPIRGDVTQGTALPLSAAAGQLFIAGDCAGLYRATGLSDGSTITSKSNLVSQSINLSLGWVPVERGSLLRHRVDLSVRGPLSTSQPAVVLATIGSHNASTLSVRPSGPGIIQFTMSGPGGTSTSGAVAVDVGATYRAAVVLDTYFHAFSVTLKQTDQFHGFLLSAGPVVMKGSPSTAGHDPLTVSVHGPAQPLPPDSLCQRLR